MKTKGSIFLVLVLILPLFSILLPIVKADPTTYYGFDWKAVNHEYIDIISATQRGAYRFTAQESKNVSKVILFCKNTPANETSYCDYRIGFQGDSGGDPDGVFISYVDSKIYTGRHNYTISVELTKDTVYHIVVEYVSGIPPNATHYVGINDIQPWNPYYPYNMTYDANLRSLYYDGASWSQKNTVCFVLVYDDESMRGQPFNVEWDGGDVWVMGNNYLGEQFVLTSTITINETGFYGYKVGSPPTLYVQLYNVTGSSQIFEEIISETLPTSPDWVNHTLSQSRTLKAGITYQIFLRCPDGNLSNYYKLYAPSIYNSGNPQSDVYSVTWDGDIGRLATTTTATIPLGLNSNYDASFRFKITEEDGNNAPNAPILHSPSNSTRHDIESSLTFYWNFSDPDGGDTQGAYEFELDNNSDFSNPEIDSGKNSTSNEFHIATIPSNVDRYHWRVRTWDNHDLVGAWNSTFNIIADRVNVTLSVSDSRINVGSTADISNSSVYAYDGSSFGGTITLNDTLTKSGVGEYDFTVSSISDPTHGLTVFQSNNISVVFDRQQLQTLGTNDTSPEQNQIIEMWLTTQSEHDAHALGSGDEIELKDHLNNVYVFTWNGTMFTNVTSWDTNGTYNINSYEKVNETTYIITVLDMNSLSLSITVGSSPPESSSNVSSNFVQAQNVLIALMSFLVLTTAISDIKNGEFGMGTVWKSVMLIAILGALGFMFQGWGY